MAFLLFFLFLPGQNYYETLHLESKKPLVRASEFDDFIVSQYPRKTGREQAPVITAKSAMVVDLESGVPLFSQNPDAQLYPASITKLMTALVALDFYPLDQILTVKRLVSSDGEAEMGLKIGDQVSVRNLLYGLLVPSGNDAAYTMADNYPGGIENFIYAMNKKAENLHMENTHFANPSGLDAPNQFSTARDIALMSVAALKNDLISQIVATSGITLTDITGRRIYNLQNINKFLSYLYGADGVKTGYTDLAGECLVASVSRDGHRLISVVLKSQDRFADSAKLLEWAYRNFSWETVGEEYRYDADN